MAGNFRATQGREYEFYRDGIVNINVAADQPIVSGDNAREIGIVLHNPSAIAGITVKKTTVRIPTSGILSMTNAAGVSVTVETTARHRLRVGNNATISGSNSTPSIDGTFAVTAVPNPFQFTFAFVPAITIAGNQGLVQAPARNHESTAVTGITSGKEIIADHTGGFFKIEITAIAGAPLAVGDALELDYRLL